MTHPWHDVTPGRRLPLEFAAVVEIPMGSSVKCGPDNYTGCRRCGVFPCGGSAAVRPAAEASRPKSRKK
jgi:hypothetical protein